jgi:predicted transcriptional regulator
MPTFTVYIDEALLADVAILAEKTKKPKGAILHMLINEAVQSRWQKYGGMLPKNEE